MAGQRNLSDVPPQRLCRSCGDPSNNSFDNFKVRDIAGPFEVDGRWFSSRGDVRVDDSDNNVLEAAATDGLEDVIVRRGFRGDKFVLTYKFKWNASSSPGILVRWLGPGDYLAVAIPASDRKARLYKRQADGTLSTLVTSGTALSVTSGNWYEAKLVIDDDPGNSALQQLGWDGHPARQRVDTDADGVIELLGGTGHNDNGADHLHVYSAVTHEQPGHLRRDRSELQPDIGQP